METFNPNFYSALNLSPTASSEEIKQAYRTLAKKYHPDRNPNNIEAERKMLAINEAYETLSDATKRKLYDQKLCTHEETLFRARMEQQRRQEAQRSRFQQKSMHEIDNTGAFIGVAFGLAALGLLVAALSDNRK